MTDNKLNNKSNKQSDGLKLFKTNKKAESPAVLNVINNFLLILSLYSALELIK